MTYTMPHNWGPGDTPAVIRWLIGITCVMSVLSALTNYLFTQLLGYMGPQEILGVSSYGLSHYLLWQPLTYLFIQDSSQGITFTFLINLLFNMYVLWILGSTLSERIGTIRFLTLYLLSGAIAGITAAWVMYLSGHYGIFTGPSAALLAIFVVWTMCNPNSQIMLFFIIPMQTKWLLAGVLGAICLISISQLDVVSLAFYCSGFIYGYLYGLVGLNLRGPFAFTHHFDKAITELVDKLMPNPHDKPKGKQSSSKIFDFSSGEPIQNDDAFVDAMLSKISKYGERSLSTSERQRMEQISKRKMKNRTH